MSARTVAVAAAALCQGLVLAQYVWPDWPGFHVWQYAAGLAIAMTALAGYALGARTGSDGPMGFRLVIPAIGVLAVAATGLVAGLLGPDPELVARAPGTVTPLPQARAAAFFGVASPAEIARGDAPVTLRRVGRPPLELGTSGRLVGESALRLVPQHAAYVDARDERGNRLTITQPTNAAFLSPVLLFPQAIALAGKTVPADAFAVPPAHRTVKAFYFDAASAVRGHVTGTGPAVLFAVDDDAGRLIPGAIGFATSGQGVDLGGLRLHATLGTYPAVAVAAVPAPLAIAAGEVLFLAGLLYAYGPLAAAGPPARLRPGAVGSGEVGE